ncbi:MAG: DUF4302 domain-containing protein [Porphyromonadaceae bacterium]|nr:DUF4302 domain-containing protein [Porphyromonadaceae bacterium]
MNLKINFAKKLILSGLFALGMGLTGCRSDKDIFDKSPEVRLDEAQSKVLGLLYGSEHGWALEFQAGENARFGGFLVVLKFNDKGEVLAASDLLRKQGSADPFFSKSLYSIGGDRAATLRFDTFNEVLHFFSRPDTRGGGGPGKGYESDFNFLIQKIHDGEKTIDLIGEKRRTTARLVKLELPMADYIAKVLEMRKVMPNYEAQSEKQKLGFTAELDGKTYTFMPKAMGNDTYVISAEGIKEFEVSFWHTDRGIRFAQPVGGAAELIYNSDTKEIKTDTGAKITELEDPSIVLYKSFVGAYKMEYVFTKNQQGEKDQGSIDISLEENPDVLYGYKIKGLGFDAVARFNRDSKTPEFHWQELHGFNLEPDDEALYWGPLQGNNLIPHESAGMYFSLVKDSKPAQYTLKGNKVAPESNRFGFLVKSKKNTWGLIRVGKLPAVMENIKLTRQ